MKKRTTFFSAVIAVILLAGTAVAQTVQTTTVTTTTRPAYRVAVPLRAALPAPAFTYVVKDSPAYAVVSEAATPRVVRGLFRDRVVQPRRQVLSVVEVAK